MRYGALLLLALSLLHATGWADALILQSGEKVEGRIVRESDAEVVIEVQVTNGILDERTYPRSEISEVQKLSPEQIAWESLSAVQLGESSLTPGGYDASIGRLEGFLREFPDSDFKPVIQERLDAFQAEKRRVAGGEMKYRGQWLAPEEVEKKKYQIAASALFDQMKALAAAGDSVGALNAFALLEKDYAGSREYPDAVALALRLIPGVGADATRRLARIEPDRVEWEKGVALAAPNQRAELVAAAAVEQKQFDAALADAAERGLKWKLLIPRSEPSLKHISDLAPRELERLSNVDIAKMRESIDHLDAGLAAMEAGDLETAEAELKTASTLWSANYGVKEAQEALAELKKDAAAATPSPSPAATPEGEPSPIVAPAATPQTTPTASPSPTPASTPAKKAAKKEEPKKPFLLTIPGALTVLGGAVIIAAGFGVAGKLRKPPPDVDEPADTPPQA